MLIRSGWVKKEENGQFWPILALKINKLEVILGKW